MAAINEAIAFLRSCDTPNISEAARKFKVDRSTLSRQFSGKSGSKDKADKKQQLLTEKQELVLVNHITRLSEWCLPPTPAMVTLWASQICGKEPGKNWSTAFRARHKDVLDSRYLNAIDLARHKADSEPSYRQYFTVLKQKIDQYAILPQNCYNMDEKGFLIGHLQKSKRIFSKAMMKQQRLLGTGQDGSREWITIVATICADGSSLPPALIYKAVSGDLQDSWLQDYDPEEHPSWFASSPNGWTSNELGVSWLQSLFIKETATKAKRDWRLLIVDGHGSHLTLKFLGICQSHRILLAVYPPHSTHRLQPLDVSLFRPLATYYSQSIDHFTRLSQGLATITKRDFFKNFYPSFDRAFTEANMVSGWHRTGIAPFQPEEVLKIFKKDGGEGSEGSETERCSRSHTTSCLGSPSAMRTIRRIVNEEVAQRDAHSQRVIESLGETCLSLAARCKLAEDRERGYLEALNSEKKKRKRGRPLMEELRAQEGSGALFFSPSKIQKARELQDAKEAAKEQEAQEKVQKAQDRANQKAQKQLEAQGKRADRVARAAARKTEVALKKAQREAQKKAKETRMQLETESRVTTRRPLKPLKAQQRLRKPVVVGVQAQAQDASNQLQSRSGRTIRTPAHLCTY